MTFESAFLAAEGGYDRADARAWLEAADFAWLDPVGGEVWHLSATPKLAALRRETREAQPDHFPVGVQVTLEPGGVRIAALASAADLARLRDLVEHLLTRGHFTARVDREDPREDVLDALFPDPLPATADLIDDPLADDAPGARWQLALGAGDAPGGYRRLRLHVSGAIEAYTERDGAQRFVTGELSAEARLAWLDAAAYVDPDADDVAPGLPPERVGIYEHGVGPDDDDAVELVFDVEAPPTSLVPLAGLAESWWRVLDESEGDSLPDLPVGD